jgi:uracil-DNA glycosylase
MGGPAGPHIAPVNALVDRLRAEPGKAGVPYVAPVYGGVNARVLFVARDPGPKTQADHGGSGFLSLDNDDPSAERFAKLLETAGVPVAETLRWNAYPWYINRRPEGQELDDGAEALRQLLGLLPRLRVVVLLGRSAQDGWRRLARQHPDLAAGLEVVPTYHTSNQAFIGTAEVRAQRMAALTDAFARVARILEEPGLATIVGLLRKRNDIDASIAALIGRPMTSGHLGEWIAAHIFDIALEDSAAAPASDGQFRSGPPQGRTVNTKWYLKQEGALDMTDSAMPDFYLVMTGPYSAAASSRSSTRPWHIDAVYIFDAAELLAQQQARRVKTGVASSVIQAQWQAAEIHPAARNTLLPLRPEQVSMLQLFASPAAAVDNQSSQIVTAVAARIPQTETRAPIRNVDLLDGEFIAWCCRSSVLERIQIAEVRHADSNRDILGGSAAGYLEPCGSRSSSRSTF